MRMTWDEIVNKYPNQYVGLANTEIDSSGELASAEVLFNYTFDPDDLQAKCPKLCSIFWTGELSTCPALALSTVRKRTISKRMSWPEIVKKYPDQWVGLINTIWKENDCPTNIKSAIVIIEDADWTELQVEGACGYLDVIPTGDLSVGFTGIITILE